MADKVRKVSYCYVMVPNRAGHGAAVLQALAEAGVNLLAYCGFPAGGGKAQLDLVAEKLGAVRQGARRQGWRLSRNKKGFLVQGDDRVGAVNRHVAALAGAGGSIIAADAASAGRGRLGIISWVL